MVAQFFDRHDCLLGGRCRNKKRIWPKLPPEQRLERWFGRVLKSSAFMRTSKSETHLRLPASIARELGLADAAVVIVDMKSTTELLSKERSLPLAVVRV